MLASINIRIALMAVLLASCSACPKGEHGAALTPTEVVRLANAAASSAGYSLSRFEAPQPHYEFVQRDCTWSVFYEPRGKSVTSGFLVLVHDHTKRVAIHGSL